MYRKNNEIMDLRRRMEAGLLPRILMYHARTKGYAFNESKEGKELELQEIIKQNQPELLKEWIIHEVPNYFLNDGDVARWTILGREVFHPSEMEEFIVWENRDRLSQERQALRELVWIAADIHVDRPRYEANWKRLNHAYIAAVAYPQMALRFGVNYHKELPSEETDPTLATISERIGWQLNEMQGFIVICLRILARQLTSDPIQIQSTQYEEPVRDKTQGEMIDIMAQELSNLPRFQAHTKIIKEEDGKQSVWKGKIQTLPLFPEYPNNNQERIFNFSSELCTKREEIEAQIRERQEKWRRPTVEASTPQVPPTPKPPPTSD